MRWCTPLFFAGVFAGCDDLTPSDEPPELLLVMLDCDADHLDVEVHTRDATGVATVTVAPQVDGVEPDTAYLDIEYTDLSVERWEVGDLSHDCTVPLEVVVSATNLWGQTAETAVWWPEVEPELEGVVPPHGPDVGGGVATIHGDDLEYVSAVHFGEAEATIQATTAGSVEVEIPAGTAGPVDVVLTIQGEAVVLDEAYTYYPDATGLYGGLIRSQVFLYDTSWFTIGSAYGSIDYGPFFQVEIALHEPVPVNETFFGNAPLAGDCEWSSGAAWTNIDAGNYVVLDGVTMGSQALLNNAPDDLMYVRLDDNLDYGLYDRERFDLVLEGGVDIPEQTIAGALQMPPLLTDPDLDFLTAYTHTHGEDITITWTPDSSIVGVAYRVHASQGPTSLASVSCTAPGADGTVTIAWDDLVAGLDESQVDGLHFEIDVWTDTVSSFEHDHSALWARGNFKHWVYAPLEEEP